MFVSLLKFLGPNYFLAPVPSAATPTAPSALQQPTVREALLRVADQFERDPGSYMFMRLFVPDIACAPGCVIGHVAREMGYSSNQHVGCVCLDIFGWHQGRLYDELIKLNHGSSCWTRDAKCAAAVMRKFADKHFPATA
jgi:hypothetical protein